MPNELLNYMESKESTMINDHSIGQNISHQTSVQNTRTKNMMKTIILHVGILQFSFNSFHQL